MSLMLFFERVYIGIVIVLVRLLWKKSEQRYKFEPLEEEEELGSPKFPVVLIQIPMFDEKEVYKISIGAACGLSWLPNRLVIQILDGSTDPVIKQMVEQECKRWAVKGIKVVYQIRETRGGYKADALKEGLKRSYVKHCEYVAVIDADFRPEPNFLRRSISFLVRNPEIALVQARWIFGKRGGVAHVGPTYYVGLKFEVATVGQSRNGHVIEKTCSARVNRNLNGRWTEWVKSLIANNLWGKTRKK